MRFFNTAGPIQPDIHYHIPPLTRLDVDDLLLLIRQRKYFVLHAPRQTGKTSALLALRDELNAGDEFRCAYVNVEVGQSAREDVNAAMQAILSALALSADDRSVEEVWSETLATAGPHMALQRTLAHWSESDARPLVLMIDEIDALIGDTLIAVLRQLRAGYPERPGRFPQSVILCGVRDVRDYRIHSSAENAIIAGGSAFNVRAESLRLGDFSRGEVDSLLTQHTEETVQDFTDEARCAVWELTRGQPWLVNALAYEACFGNRGGRDRTRPITAEAIQDAREQLILRRETHLDQLADKLREERVRRVIEPLLSGGAVDSIAADDIQYARDLGLVGPGKPLDVANPIYREVIPRDLTYTTQEMMIHDDPAWFVGEDGSLLTDKLLTAFQAFFREHSEHWVERFQYKQRGRSSVAAPGVPAENRQQRGADRTRVWSGSKAYRSADPVADERTCRRHRPDRSHRQDHRNPEGRRRVQGAAQGSRTDAARKDWRRRAPAWTAARPGKDTWCSSTVPKTRRGTRRSIVAMK